MTPLEHATAILKATGLHTEFYLGPRSEVREAILTAVQAAMVDAAGAMREHCLIACSAANNVPFAEGCIRNAIPATIVEGMKDHG